MRCSGGHRGFVPFLVLAQESGLFLRARDGDTKILIIAHAERGSGEVVDDGGDLIIGDGVTIGGTGSAGIDAVREELQRADAVVAECGQQAVGVRATRADAFGNALADRVAVRKQVVEDVDDGRTDIAVFAQKKGE